MFKKFQLDHVIFFFGRENHPAYFVKGFNYKWGAAQILIEGTDGVIVAAGPMIPKALAAQELLKEQGKNLTVINSPFINRPDTKVIGELLRSNQSKLITLEDHQIIGGLGAQLIHALKIDGYSFKVKSLGIPGKFGQSAYKADHLYDVYGLSPEGVVKAFKELSQQ